MANSTKPLILVVDDTPKNLQVLGKILYELGYNVAVANSGIQALDSIEKEKPDLVLLDIQMPEMDGFEVCSRLKKSIDTKDIPIIFLTAMHEFPSVIKAFEVGAVDYITKPFNTAELTARVATHLEIKQSREKLSEMNSMKDKFFRIIAHDLRNPFVGIIGLSESIAKILSSPDKESIERILKYNKIILSSATSTATLLENLLKWAKSQSGFLEINPKCISLTKVFEKNLELISGVTLKKEIIIEKIIEEDQVFVDEMMFNTILRNLLSNAVKFTGIGGKISLFARKIDDWVKISIQDTGIGIEPKNIEKIFRIDSKFTSLGTEKEKGSGLGLILCKEFVEKLGGEIWLTSEIGKGTIFSFTIPVRPLVKSDEK